MKKFCINTLCFAVAVFLSLIVIGAAFPYNPDGFVREQLAKDDFLSRADREPYIVLCGGSNVAFGYDCDLIMNSLQRSVYNNGVHAGIGLKFILDNTARNLRKGDILIISPEYSQFYGDEYFGHQPMTDLVYLNFGEYSKILSLKQWWAVANFTPMSIMSRISYTASTIVGGQTDNVYCKSGFNSNGDLVGYRSLPSKEIPVKTAAFQNFNEESFECFVRTLKEIEQKGVTVLLYPPPVYDKRFEVLKVNADELALRLSEAGYPFICLPDDCTYGKEKFFDTAYHLNKDGAEQNSLHLTRLLEQGNDIWKKN